MSKDEDWFIKRLSDPTTSEADLHGCIDVLEVLLSVESIPVLIGLVQNADVAFSIRLRAATAIKCIDNPAGRKFMSELVNSNSYELKKLAKLALS